jgi:hypothetical protein
MCMQSLSLWAEATRYRMQRRLAEARPDGAGMAEAEAGPGASTTRELVGAGRPSR